ncbi:hypothetical protein BDR26DRAFT_1000861 [Obelidium mucronatum]|nr:hypothetical protein BDR26DRAFT_1000861 [Obelidium mucronatum]
MLTPGATYVAPLQTIALSDMTFHQAAGNDLFEYFGNLGTTSIVPVTNARTAAAGSRYIPYFDHQHNLQEILATQSSNTFSTAVATDLVSQDPNSVLEFNAFSNGLACPYSRMVFVVPTDDHAIQNTDTGIDVLESLPSKIYLDYKETYSFSIRMMPSPEITNTETVKLGFRLSNTDAVKMSYTRHVESDGEIVKLTDLGVQGQSYPGVNLKGTILIISPAGGNFACKNLTKVSQWISIHSGCAPHQSIEFIAGSDSSSSSVVSSAHGTVTTTTTSSSSTTTELCPDPDPSVPCMWYAYPIKFSIYNALTHKYTPFNWTYQLEIVGGGLSNSDIKMFTSDQVARFNPNTSGTQKNLIWSDSSPSEITWLCQMGSPCYGILPSATNSTTSNYYIVFRVSTKSDAFATDSHSYCILETDFHVRLYGIPESFEASLAVTFGSMAVVLLVALGIVWVEWWWFSEERERKRKVYPVVSPSSEETLLGQQGGGGGGEEEMILRG